MTNMKSSRNLWPYGIILTFILFISGTVGLVVMACAQKSDLVSPDYYEQEIRFQTHLDQANRAQLPGASITYETATRQIRIALPKSVTSEKAIGAIEFYRPSAAKLDRHLVLDPDSRGWQSIDAGSLANGLWKVRLTWTCAGEDFFMERSVLIK
jgi:hypothetical protein